MPQSAQLANLRERLWRPHCWSRPLTGETAVATAHGAIIGGTAGGGNNLPGTAEFI
jgi:hypothetical protein